MQNSSISLIVNHDPKTFLEGLPALSQSCGRDHIIAERSSWWERSVTMAKRTLEIQTEIKYVKTPAHFNCPRREVTHAYRT